jgi:hypothetical protein
MDTVQFISIEDEEPDLILSFALYDEGMGIKSLILLRTPEFEILLPESERGTKVSMEGDEYLETDLLVEILLNNDTATISTHTKSYELDISRVEKEDLEEMQIIIEKLNFDSSFNVSNA